MFLTDVDRKSSDLLIGGVPSVSRTKTGIFRYSGAGLEQSQPLSGEVWLDDEAQNRHAVVSPAGGWIAWEDNADGRFEVNVSRWPGDPKPIPLTTTGAEAPEWSQDGRTLFFLDGDGANMIAVSTTGDPERPFSQPQRQFELPVSYVRNLSAPFGVFPNGDFLVPLSDNERHHRLVFNWTNSIKRSFEEAGEQ